ncbi:MAG: peptidylprolyl isomerase [Acidobacteriota bacterium]|nr:peptidylprolyl isomerase [Acidobacteriota bacterium]
MMTRTICGLVAIGLAVAGPALAKETEDKALAQVSAMIKKLTAEGKIDKSKESWRTALPKPEVLTFDPDRSYFMRMKTNKGDLLFKMMPDVAPFHVTNFMYLGKLGYYDGLTFHRVIKDFMAQGGCPLGNGLGGPGYRYGGEFKKGVIHDGPGKLSMANGGAKRPNTDGSQFFVTFKATPWLDGQHTISGEVVEGLETLKTLEAAGSPRGQTSERLVIEKVTFEVR